MNGSAVQDHATNEAVLHLRSDLVESGMRAYDVAVVERSYERALRAPSEQAWQRFYEEVLAALLHLSGKRRRLDKRTRRATESLLRLIDDDLGSALVDPAVAVQLRRTLIAPSRGKGLEYRRRRQRMRQAALR